MYKAGEAPKKYHSILDDKHFCFLRTGAVKNGVTQIFANCLLCHGGREVLGDTKSSGNFIKHLQKRHSSEYETYLKGKRNHPDPDETQPTMKKFCSVVSVTSGLQNRIEKLTIDYIVYTMKPLSTVDDPYFRRLIRGAAQNPTLKLLNHKSLAVKINQTYKDTVKELATKMKPLDYLCLTADCWSSHSRAFLGVTAHWIKSDFTRESAVLACMRFKGTHSYDKIAEQLNNIMTKYSIRKEQVVAIVTDNGSNFCKAFKEFGIEFNDKNAESNQEIFEEENLETDLDNDDEILNHDVDEMFGESTESYTLPPHFRCTSHTLSLVATKDGLNVKDKRLYNAALGKCTKLWNLSSSPKSFEKIMNVCGVSLKRPVPTRWNSLYDSLECLLKVESSFDKLCEELGVASFQTREVELLKEFVKISQPVAIALDKLQGEYGIFMGSLLPTLVRVKSMITNLKEKTVHCKNFLAAYLEGIDKRFGEIMQIDTTNLSDIVFASLTNPVFKLRWVPLELHEGLKKQFILKAREFSITEATNKNVTDEFEDPFYKFDDAENEQSFATSQSISSVELECVKYFNDASKALSMLHLYPTVHKMFRRYNTALPSSAPVERVFSYAGLILSSRRTSLSDAKFEKLVLLNCNNVFMPDLTH